MQLTQDQLLQYLGYDQEGVGRVLPPAIQQWLATQQQTTTPELTYNGDVNPQSRDVTTYTFDNTYGNEFGEAPIGPDGQPLWLPSRQRPVGRTLARAGATLGGAALFGNAPLLLGSEGIMGLGAAEGATTAAPTLEAAIAGLPSYGAAPTIAESAAAMAGGEATAGGIASLDAAGATLADFAPGTAGGANAVSSAAPGASALSAQQSAALANSLAASTGLPLSKITSFLTSQAGLRLLGGGLGLALGAAGARENKPGAGAGAMGGFQGPIPQYTLNRQYNPRTDPNRRPGGGGAHRYFTDTWTKPGFAQGGIADLQPRMINGPGDGMSDSVPANIDGQQQAALADGEFVIPADVVSHLGNGSSDAGARRLYSMMDRIRQARTGSADQAPAVNAKKYLPQ